MLYVMAVYSESPGDLNGGRKALHRAVAERLRRRISDGHLNLGEKLPTLRELAEEYDVSTMTVRVAIRTLEREGQVHRIPGVGVFAGSPQQRHHVPRQKMLAFVAIDLTSSFPMAIARGISRACQQRGWALQILDAHFDVHLEAKNILQLPSSGARGAIILPPWDPENVDPLYKLQASDFPLVLIDRTRPGLNADLVESDHERGAYEATRYMLEHGHRRVILLTHPQGLSSITARLRGYERALRGSGIHPDPDWIVCIDPHVQSAGVRENRKWYGGYQAIVPVLEALAPPVAIFCIDPPSAWGVYEACRKLGLRIPEDVSVIGFDDSEIAHTMRPPMTTIAQRTEDIGIAAVDLLARRLEAPRSPDTGRRSFSHVVIDVDLIERESVTRVGARGRTTIGTATDATRAAS